MYIPNEHSVAPPTLDYYADARDAFVGDPASELAALLVDHVRESRQSYLDQTHAEESHLRLVQAAQIKELRHEADKLRDAGRANAYGLLGSGALKISSGVAIASTGTPNNPYSKGFEGGADGSAGAGTFYASGEEHQGQLARTRATEHEHLGGEAERRLKTLDEARAHARDLERSAFEHLRNVQETEAATDQALVTWRG